ncbi:hypothetical protein AWW66_03165 [Micromonospora rosaria]|uniref:HTH cro/C1-type domain-containing protein n=1 Tax=Micromonospora rosaria TaxID=47874 RepID=A0A136PY92_9ACTN|nr:helix-turn-helix transcriptional regulator [Micromonospora rosaria]KXK63327.1 hypothetical protein AWW66_03165 [Micromonospora rosaria]
MESSSIGDNLAQIRRESRLTQEQLAERSGVSIEVISKLEQGRRQGARIPTLNKLARALRVPTSALFGDGARAAADRDPDANPISLVGVRQVLAPAVGLGGPTANQADPPPTLATARQAVADASRSYYADDYATTLGALPRLLFTARDLVAATDGDDQLTAHGIAAEAHQVAAQLLLQLRQVDLAHTAATTAVDHARRSGVQTIGASVICTLVWVLMREGRFDEAERLAVDTADQVEPRLSTATVAELSAWGWLLLRGAAAAARDARDDTAQELLSLATAGASRLDGRPVPPGEFGAGEVRVMQVETAVIAGQPDRALELSEGMPTPAGGVASWSWQRHRLDVAHVRAQLGQYADATAVLRDLADRSPAWLRQQRYARDIVDGIAAGRRRAMTDELAELAELVGCTSR